MIHHPIYDSDKKPVPSAWAVPVGRLPNGNTVWSGQASVGGYMQDRKTEIFHPITTTVIDNTPFVQQNHYPNLFVTGDQYAFWLIPLVCWHHPGGPGPAPLEETCLVYCPSGEQLVGNKAKFLPSMSPAPGGSVFWEWASKISVTPYQVASGGSYEHALSRERVLGQTYARAMHGTELHSPWLLATMMVRIGACFHIEGCDSYPAMTARQIYELTLGTPFKPLLFAGKPIPYGPSHYASANGLTGEPAEEPAEEPDYQIRVPMGPVTSPHPWNDHGQFGDEGLDQAFDNNIGTKALTFRSTGVLHLDEPEGYNINLIDFDTGNDAPERDPRMVVFTLNNGVKHTIYIEQTNKRGTTVRTTFEPIVASEIVSVHITSRSAPILQFAGLRFGYIRNGAAKPPPDMTMPDAERVLRYIQYLEENIRTAHFGDDDGDHFALDLLRRIEALEAKIGGAE